MQHNAINWKPFFENTSTRDALQDFIDGQSFHKAFVTAISWPMEVTQQYGRILRLPVCVARRRAREAFKRYH